MSVEIPKCAITLGPYSIAQSDVIELKVHLGCTKEVSSFEILLENWNGKYSPGGTYPLSVGQDGHADVGRGANVPQIITTRTESIRYESTPTENYVRVSGRCWGEKLFRKVVTKTYINQKGEAVVKDLLDNYVGLSHVRNGTELVENTDTTYTKLEYTDSPVWDILKYIAESSDVSGFIGFDFRVAPDGKFEFFPKNSKTLFDIFGEKIEVSEYRKDITRIRNKIMVYGIADKSTPTDKIAWCESLTPTDGVWSATSGTVSFDTSFKARGVGSIKLYAQNLYDAGALFTLNSGKEVNCNIYPILGILAFLEKASFNGNVIILLYDVAQKYAIKNLTLGPDEWRKTELRVGAVNATDWESVQEGFDWTQVKYVKISCAFISSVGTGSFWVDELYFGGRRYSAVEEDTASQQQYTDGEPRELSETDEELWSDNECDLRAKALLEYLKSPATYLTIRSTVIDYGNNPPLAGDRAHVLLPNENVDSNFRIESVEYNVDAPTQTLEIVFQLEKEPPQLADYLYGLRTWTVNVEKLARTKLGKGPVGGGGGGSGGTFPFADWESMIEQFGPFPKSAIQWKDIWRYMPNINKNLMPMADNTYDLGEGDAPLRWRNVFGVNVFPNNIGPYADSPAILQFRTRAKNGTTVVDHEFDPMDHEHGVLGSFTKSWKEAHAKYFITPYLGYYRIWNTGEDNPLAELTKESISFGPGGSSTLDTWIKRKNAGVWEVRYDLVPTGDNGGKVGYSDLRWSEVRGVEIYGTNVHASEVGDFGWLKVANFIVMTADRILQNVTANASIITSGQFPLTRLPRSISGYVLEAQGVSYDPMYVDPNGRYTPAGHDHAAGNITSGVLDEARIPTVFTNSRTFNGGITLGAALNMNSQAIQNLASLNQAMPPGANQGNVGTTSTYWNCIAGNSVWYKALGQFDFLDDLGIIRGLRTRGRDKNGVPLIDPTSLPPEITQNGLINAGNLTGLLIGAIKQLAAEVESLKKQIKGG